ncbi:MAG: Rpn family recombination-promoting nuclease/putative transposase [Caldimicrobium sp.]
MAENLSKDFLAKAFLKNPENLKALLVAFLPEQVLKYLDLSNLKLLSEEQISLERSKRFIPDLVAVTTVKNKPLYLYILIEHKSYPDKRAYLQILNYICALNEKALKEEGEYIPVLPIIFYEGDKPWPYPEAFVDLYSLPEVLKEELFKVHVIDVKRVDDERFKILLDLAAGFWCYLYLLSLEGGELEAYLQGLLEVIERLGAITEKGRFEIGFLVKIAALKTGLDEREILIKLIERGGEKVVREIRTVWDIIADEARMEGLKQGLKQGLQQGILQTLKAVKRILLDAIEDKFGEVPEELRIKIEAETDQTFLEKLLYKAIVAKNPEELFEEFKK